MMEGETIESSGKRVIVEVEGPLQTGRPASKRTKGSRDVDDIPDPVVYTGDDAHRYAQEIYPTHVTGFSSAWLLSRYFLRYPLYTKVNKQDLLSCIHTSVKYIGSNEKLKSNWFYKAILFLARPSQDETLPPEQRLPLLNFYIDENERHRYDIVDGSLDIEGSKIPDYSHLTDRGWEVCVKLFKEGVFKSFLCNPKEPDDIQLRRSDESIPPEALSIIRGRIKPPSNRSSNRGSRRSISTTTTTTTALPGSLIKGSPSGGRGRSQNSRRGMIDDTGSGSLLNHNDDEVLMGGEVDYSQPIMVIKRADIVFSSMNRNMNELKELFTGLYHRTTEMESELEKVKAELQFIRSQFTTDLSNASSSVASSSTTTTPSTAPLSPSSSSSSSSVPHHHHHHSIPATMTTISNNHHHVHMDNATDDQQQQQQQQQPLQQQQQQQQQQQFALHPDLLK